MKLGIGNGIGSLRKSSTKGRDPEFIFQINTGFDFYINPNGPYTITVTDSSDVVVLQETRSAGFYQVQIPYSDVFDVSFLPDESNPFTAIGNISNLVKDIKQWGTTKWASFETFFQNSNLTNYSALDTPDLSNCTSFRYTFADSNFNWDINDWDVSNIQNMAYAFAFNNAFNQPLDKWDVSNVTNMDAMFAVTSQFNQDLTGWCVQNIPSLPLNFATNSALDPANYPVWGTCPS
jgi:surface protein